VIDSISGAACARCPPTRLMMKNYEEMGCFLPFCRRLVFEDGTVLLIRLWGMAF